MAAAKDPVVVGVDGSDQSIGALRWAADEAQWRQRQLRVVHAAGTSDPHLCADGERLVDEAVARVRTMHPALTASGFVYGGPPVVELCAESEHALLVVVGSRGRGGLAGLLLGSVGAQLAAHAHSPILVVRHGELWAGEHATPASRLPVLVGLDGSPASELAAELAFEEAAAHGIGVLALRAWRPPPVAWRSDVRPLVRDMDEIETAERHLLSEQVEAWRGKYPDVPVHLKLVPDSPGAALVSASSGTQLAVVGSRGRGGLHGLLLGSASQQLLHHAACPVLVVHAS